MFDLPILQNLYNLTNKISVLFLDKESEVTHNITDFEDSYHHLDYLTQVEQEEIKAGMGNFFVDIFSQFTFFAIVTGLIFLFSIELMNIISRKKDLSIMLILGTSKMKIMGLIWLEIMILTSIGIIIGIPISLFIYFSFFALLQVSLGNDPSFWSAFERFASNNFKGQTFGLALQSIGIIFIGGLLIAIIPALLIFRLNILEEIKDKN